jgi:hypothetical protein
MPQQLAPEIATEQFARDLADCGVTWVVEHEKGLWPDYSQTDAVLAIRSFQPPLHSRKPATKLYNAWIAGVPAILGPEPAFQHEGTPGADYIEAQTLTDVVNSIRSLRENPELRKAMVARGTANADRYRVPSIVDDWRQLLESRLQPLLERWQGLGGLRRRFFLAGRKVNFMTRRLPRRIRPSFNPFI